MDRIAVFYTVCREFESLQARHISQKAQELLDENIQLYAILAEMKLDNINAWTRYKQANDKFVTLTHERTNTYQQLEKLGFTLSPNGNVNPLVKD